MTGADRDNVVTTQKLCATMLTAWKEASPISITGLVASARAASSPVSSKQAMIWASAPSRSALSISHRVQGRKRPRQKAPRSRLVRTTAAGR